MSKRIEVDFDSPTVENSIQLPVVPDNTGYWFVRIDGGKQFENFYTEGLIAVNQPEITVDGYKDLVESSGITPIDSLFAKLSSIHVENTPQRNKNIAKKLYLLGSRVRKGDRIIIPSKETKKLLIGIIQDNSFSERSDSSNLPPGYNKIRSVEWKEIVDRRKVYSKLHELVSNRYNYVDASEYRDLIEPYIHSVYVYKNTVTLSLELGVEEQIPVRTFYSFLEGVFGMVDIEVGDGEFFGDMVTIAPMFNSPGRVLLKLKAKGQKLPSAIGYVAILGLIVVTLNGGTLEINSTNGITLKTPGLLHYVERAFPELLSVFKSDPPDQKKLAKLEAMCEALRILNTSSIKDDILTEELKESILKFVLTEITSTEQLELPASTPKNLSAVQPGDANAKDIPAPIGDPTPKTPVNESPKTPISSQKPLNSEGENAVEE